MNRQAGNEILKFIRDEGFRTPVLIFTTPKTLPMTRYVELYENAASIGGDFEGYKNYVSALAARRNGWM